MASDFQMRVRPRPPEPFLGRDSDYDSRWVSQFSRPNS